MIAVRVYVQMNFVEKGMCADWVLHDKGDGNPHAHIMLTTRPIRKNGRWGDKQKSVYKLDGQGNKIAVIDPDTGKQKVRIRKGKGEEKLWERVTVPVNDWNSPGKAEEWRKAWADCLNALLPAEKQVDHRSYARQGIAQEPTIHEGYAARKREKQGRAADRCQINRDIRSRNALLQHLQTKIKEIAAELAEMMKKEGGDVEMKKIKAGQLKDVVDAMEERQMLVVTFEDEEEEDGSRTGCCADQTD